MKLRDEHGRFITDNWVNRIKAIAHNERIQIGVIALLVVLAAYELAGAIA